MYPANLNDLSFLPPGTSTVQTGPAYGIPTMGVKRLCCAPPLGRAQPHHELQGRALATATSTTTTTGWRPPSGSGLPPPVRQPIVTITNGVAIGRGTLPCAPPPMARSFYEASAVAAIAPPSVSGPPAASGPAAPRDRAEARARPPAGHVPAIFVTVGTEVKKEPAGPVPARQEIPHPGAA